MSDTQDIPSGKYDAWAVHHNPEAALDSPLALPITADKEGAPQVCIKIALAEKGQPEGQEEAFASATIYQTVDPDAPCRGNTETTPYEFAILCLLALGADSREAINGALGAAFEAGASEVVIPGLGKPGSKADAVVKYTQNRTGTGLFMNVAIFARRDVAPDKAKSLADRFKTMGKGSSGGAPPPAFAPRGRPIAPPQPAAK